MYRHLQHQACALSLTQVGATKTKFQVTMAVRPGLGDIPMTRSYTAVVSNLRPEWQIRSAKAFNPARRGAIDMDSIWFTIITF